jgi:hypothetical protein
MALALEVVAIKDAPNGGLEIEYRFGVPPLSGGTSSYTFASAEELRQRLNALSTDLDPFVLLLLHLAMTFVANNGTLRNRTSVTGKTLEFDVTAASVFRLT